MTRADIEYRVRELAFSLPPSDFGSTRAIQATASLILDLLEAERARCIAAINNHGAA